MYLEIHVLNYFTKTFVYFWQNVRTSAHKRCWWLRYHERKHYADALSGRRQPTFQRNSEADYGAGTQQRTAESAHRRRHPSLENVLLDPVIVSEKIMKLIKIS